MFFCFLGQSAYSLSLFFCQDTIRQCVQNKLKKERRPLVSVQEVENYKEKFGSKGRGRKRSTDLDIVGPCAKARRRVSRVTLIN